ncbi:hypothetical protein DSUL_50277 [Desulfovibrionales bacterium]
MVERVRICSQGQLEGTNKISGETQAETERACGGNSTHNIITDTSFSVRARIQTRVENTSLSNLSTRQSGLMALTIVSMIWTP